MFTRILHCCRLYNLKKKNVRLGRLGHVITGGGGRGIILLSSPRNTTVQISELSKIMNECNYINYFLYLLDGNNIFSF